MRDLLYFLIVVAVALVCYLVARRYARKTYPAVTLSKNPPPQSMGNKLGVKYPPKGEKQ